MVGEGGAEVTRTSGRDHGTDLQTWGEQSLDSQGYAVTLLLGKLTAGLGEKGWGSRQETPERLS